MSRWSDIFASKARVNLPAGDAAPAAGPGVASAPPDAASPAAAAAAIFADPPATLRRRRKRLIETLETLEPRRLFDTASFASITFDDGQPGNTSLASLRSVLSATSGNPSATFTGNIKVPNGQAVSVTSAVVRRTAANTFTIDTAAVGLPVGGLVSATFTRVAGDSSVLTLTGSGTNASNGTITGQFSSTVAVNFGEGGLSLALPQSFASTSFTLAADAAANTLRVGVGARFTVAGQQFEGTVGFSGVAGSTDLSVYLSNVTATLSTGTTEFNLPGISATFTYAGSTKTLSGSGTVSIANRSYTVFPGVTFSGGPSASMTLSVAADRTITFSANNVGISNANASLTASFSLSAATTVGTTNTSSTSVLLLTSSLSTTIGSAGGQVSFSQTPGSQGQFLFISGAASGVVAGTLSLSAGTAASASGQAALLFNTGSRSIAFADPFSADPDALLVVPSGPAVSLFARGLSVTASGNTIVGDYSFTAAPGFLQASAQKVTASFGKVGITNGNAAFQIATGTFVGSAGGTATFTSPEATLDGTLAATIASTGSVTISATGLQLNIAGQTLAGDFAITSSATGTTFDVAHVTYSYQGDTLIVSDVTGSLNFPASGSFSTSLSGNLAVNLGGLTLSGGVSINLQPGSNTVTGSNVLVSVGGQTVSGNFTFSTSGGAVAVSATGLTATFSSGSASVITVAGASLTASIDTGVFTGSFTGSLAATFGSVSLSGNTSVSVSNSAIAASVTQGTLTLGGVAYTADLFIAKDPAGVSVAVSNLNLSLGGLTINGARGSLQLVSGGFTGSVSAASVSATLGSVSLSGGFSLTFAPGAFSFSLTSARFEQVGVFTLTADLSLSLVTVSGVTQLTLDADNFSANLGNGLVTLESPPASTPNVSPTTLKIANGALSGSFAALASVGTNAPSGLALSGLFTFSLPEPVAGVQSFSASATNVVVSVGGQQVTGNATLTRSGSDLSLALSGVNFAIGSVLSVQNAGGSLTFAPTGLSGDLNGSVSASIPGLSSSVQLALSFAPGAIRFAATNAAISFAGQKLAGDFVFSSEPSGITLAVTNFRAALGVNASGDSLLDITGGFATFAVSAADGSLSGSFGGTLAAGPAAASLPGAPVFGGTLSASIANGAITASGTGISLGLTFGSVTQSFSGSFDFSRVAGKTNLAVRGFSLSLASGLVSISNGTGNLTLDPVSGISGSASGVVSSTIPGLAGSFGIAFSPTAVSVSGGAYLSINGQTINGNFSFSSRAGGGASLSISSLYVNLAGGLVRVGSPNGTASADLQVSPTGEVSGQFDGPISVGTASGFLLAGNVTVTVSPTDVSAVGTNVTLTVAGQSLTGNVSFARNSSTGNLSVGFSNIAFSLAGVLSLRNVSGNVAVTASGISGSLNGQLDALALAGLTVNQVGLSFSPGVLSISATGASLAVGGQLLSGDFRFLRNPSGTFLTASNLTAILGNNLVRVDGGSATLSLPTNGGVSGSFAGAVSAGSNAPSSIGFSGLVMVNVTPDEISASGTNNILTVGSFALATDFSFSYVRATQTLNLGVANLSVSLDDSLGARNASGSLRVSPAGLSGDARGTIFANFSNLTLLGDLAISFASSAGVTSLTLTGTDNTLIAGGQTIRGGFSFTRDADGILLSATNFSADLGGGLVRVTNGSGKLAVGNGAVTGSFEAQLAAGDAGGNFAFSGGIAVTVAPGSISAATPVGVVNTLTIAGQSISASFGFTKNATGLNVSVSNLSLQLGGAISLTNGGGQLSVTSAGISGNVSGTIATTFTGFSFSGTLAAVFAPGTFSLAGTNLLLSAGGQTLGGDFSFTKTPTSVNVTASNLLASFAGGLVSISDGSGQLSLDNGQLTGFFMGTVSAGGGAQGFSFGGGIRVDVAPGSIQARTLDGQPATLTVAGQTISAGLFFRQDATGVVLTLSGVNLNFGNGLLTVTNAGGTVSVLRSGLSGSISGGLSANIPGVSFAAQGFSVAFAAGSLAVSGTGVSLTAYGQTLSGNFAFSQVTTNNVTTTNLNVSNLSLSIGGIVNVTDGQGDFTLTNNPAGGLTGSASGRVSISGLPAGIEFGGSYAVTVAPGSVAVSGVGAYLAIFGQRISGNFAFVRSGTDVNLQVSALNLSLGDGLLSVTGGAASLQVTSAGVSGSASGSIATGPQLSGVSFSGTVAVNFGVSGVTVVGTNLALSLGGFNLTAGQVSFARSSQTGAINASFSGLNLGVDGVSVAFGGVLGVTPAGLAGTLTGNGSLGGVNGTITATFGNGTFTFTAGVSAEFSQNIGDTVLISGKVAAEGGSGGASVSLTDLVVSIGPGLVTITGGSADFARVNGQIQGSFGGTLLLSGVPGVSLGGTVTVTISPTSLVATGTGLRLEFLGQTITGNFTVTDNRNGTVRVQVQNFTMQFSDVVALTDGTADFTIGSNGTGSGGTAGGTAGGTGTAGIRGTGSARLAVNLPGLTIGSVFSMLVDTTGGQSLFRFTASSTITVAGIEFTGDFTLQRVALATGGTTTSVVFRNVTGFFGDPASNTGLQIAGGRGALLVLATGVALDVGGTASLVGVSGLTLTGSVRVRVNNTGSAVNQRVPAPDPNNPGGTVETTLVFGKDELSVTGGLTLGIANFVSLSGQFGFARVVSTPAPGVTLTKLLVAATGLEAFLGTGPATLADGSINPSAVGVLVRGATLGVAVLTRRTGTGAGATSTTNYGVTASGEGALLGVPGVTLTGSLAVRAFSGVAINETVSVGSVTDPDATVSVPVVFAATEPQTAFAGNVRLSVAASAGGEEVVGFSGNFAFTRQTTGLTSRLTVAATDVSAFVGVGGGGSSPLGLQVESGQFGLVVLTGPGQGQGGYALRASGNLSLVGLPGLRVSGGLVVTANTTGSAQTDPSDGTTQISAESLRLGVNGFTVSVLDGQDRPILSIGATATITKSGGITTINATALTFTLSTGDQELVRLQGSAAFTLGPAGFAMGPTGFQLTGFSILSSPIVGPPTAQQQQPATFNPGSTTQTGSGASTAGKGTPASIAVPSTTSPGPLPGGTSGASAPNSPIRLGPLTLYGLAPVVSGFSFSNGQLSANIGLRAAMATIATGQNASTGTTADPASPGGTTVRITGVTGSLQLQVGVDLSSFKITNFGPTGKFSLSAQALVVNVPNTLNISATNITVNYDPKVQGRQKVLSVESATVTVPIGQGGTSGIRGTISAGRNGDGSVRPGLVVWTDGFELASARLTYIGTLGLGGALSIVNPFVQVTNLSITAGTGLSFTGSITIGADSVTLGRAGVLQLSGTGVAATLATQPDGGLRFSFTAQSVSAQLTSVVQISGTNVTFNPQAEDNETLLGIGGLSVTVSLSALTLTGFAGSPNPSVPALMVKGNGDVTFAPNFTVSVTISAGSSGDLGWPSWIPIQIRNITLRWADLTNAPSNFTITLSASVTGNYGPIELSGDVDGITIDVGRLLAGQFPITRINSASVTAKGNVFGGTLDASLLLGVVRLNANNEQQADTDLSDPARTIFYAAVSGGFTTANGMGLTLRFALSELGPLQAYVELTGAQFIIFPPAGLAITGLAGGITFDATPFPSIKNALDLASPVFQTGGTLTVEQWQAQLRRQVLNQAGVTGGFLFSVPAGGLASVLAGHSGYVDSRDARWQPLLDAFSGSGFVLPTASTPSPQSTNPGARITTVTGTSVPTYVIVNGRDAFLVEVRNNQVVASWYRFVAGLGTAGGGLLPNAVPPAVGGVISDLNAGTVTQNVRDLFLAYGIVLDGGATVRTASEGGVTRWVITSGTYTYRVAQAGSITTPLLLVNASGGSMGALGQTIRIEAAVTLGFVGVPASSISIKGTVVIDTSGKILLDVLLRMGATGGAGQEMNFKAYLDLSNVQSGNVTVLFYFKKEIDLSLLSGLAPASVAGNGKFTQLEIAAGAEFALVDADGNQLQYDPSLNNGTGGFNGTVAGFKVSLSGLVRYFYLPQVGISLTGIASLSVINAGGTTTVKLGFSASLSATLTNFIRIDNLVTATGAFVFTLSSSSAEFYGAARLDFGTSAIPFLADAGFNAAVTIFLRINTASGSRSLTLDQSASGGSPLTLSLKAQSFGLYLVGTLSLVKGPINVSLLGVFAVDFNFRSLSPLNFDFNLFVLAQLNLNVAGVNLLTFNAGGVLIINNQGVAALLSVTVDAGSPETISFQMNFRLVLNTTGTTQTYTVPPDLTAIITELNAQAERSGAGMSPSILSRLQAQFGGLATSVAGPNGTTVLQISVPGAPPDGGPAGPYLLIQGTGTLTLLNTVVITGGVYIRAASDGLSLAIAGSATFGPLASLSVTGALKIGPAGLVAALQVNVSLDFGTSGTQLVSLNGALSLIINTTGTAQVVKMYRFVNGAVTSSPVDTTIPAGPMSSSGSGQAGPYIQIYAEGRLGFGGALYLEGRFYFSLSSSTTSSGTTVTLVLDASVTLQIFGYTLASGQVTAEFQAGPSGLQMFLRVSFSLGFSLGGALDFSAGMVLAINTFSSSRTYNVTYAGGTSPGTYTLNGNSFVFKIYGEFRLLDTLTMRASAQADYDGTSKVFTFQFVAEAGLDLPSWLPANVGVQFAGWFDSTGQFFLRFAVHADLDFVIGNVSGGLAIVVAFTSEYNADNIRPFVQFNDHGDISSLATVTPPANRTYTGSRRVVIAGGLAGQATVIGISAGINGTLTIDSDLRMTLSASAYVGIGKARIRIGFTIEVGTLGSGGGSQSFLAGTPTRATLEPSFFPGGTLVVNAGSRYFSRGGAYAVAGDDGVVRDNILVYGAGSVVGGRQKIFVTINGYTQAYNGVSAVQIPGGGPFPSSIIIDDSVRVPVDVGTSGLGSTVVGGANARLTVTSGVGADSIVTGGQATVVQGDVTRDTISVGAGAVTISPNSGTTSATKVYVDPVTSGNVTWSGRGGGDELIVSPRDLALLPGARIGTITLTRSGGNALVVAGAFQYSISGVPTVTINAPGGGRTINVGDLSGTGVTNISADYGTAADRNTGNLLSVTAAAGGDTLSLTTGGTTASPTVTISRVGGSSPLTVTASGVNVAAGDTFRLIAASGTTNFLVPQATAPVTLVGASGLASGTITNYRIGSATAGLSGVRGLITVTGGSGTDSVTLDDGASFLDRTVQLTGTDLTSTGFGTGGRLVYSLLENLDYTAGTGRLNLTVASVSATSRTRFVARTTTAVVNAPLAGPLALEGGNAPVTPNTLTINATAGNDALQIGPGLVTGLGRTAATGPLTYSNFQQLVVNGNGGNDSVGVSGVVIGVTLVGGAGDDSYTIASSSGNLTINGGDGTNNYVINGNSGTISVSGGSSNDSYSISGNAGVVSVAGGSGTNSFNVSGNSGRLTLTGGTGQNAVNTFNISGNSGQLTAVANASASFTVRGISSPVTLDATGVPASFRVFGPLLATVNVLSGGGGSRSLVYEGSVVPEPITLTSTAILIPSGTAVSYSGALAVTINGNGGADELLVLGNTGPTTLTSAADGGATFDIRSAAFPVTVDASLTSPVALPALITLGNPASSSAPKGAKVARSLASLLGRITVIGSGLDELYVSDAASTAGRALSMDDAGTVTVLSFAPAPSTTGVAYSGIARLTVDLSSGADTFAINALPRGMAAVVRGNGGNDSFTISGLAGSLSLETGAGSNTVTVGLAVTTGGVTRYSLAGLTGTLAIDGTGGTLAVTLDDSATTAPRLGLTLSNAVFAGAAAVNPISLVGLTSLLVRLGQGGDTLTINSTAAGTSYSVVGGAGADRIVVNAATSSLAITAGGGADTVTLNNAAAITGAVTVTGDAVSPDTVVVDDSASTAARTVSLTPTTLTGPGSLSLAYTNLAQLTVRLGSGADVVTVLGVAAGTALGLELGGGNNVATLSNIAAAGLSLSAGSGNDQVTLRSSAGPVTMSLGGGTDTVLVGSAAARLTGIAGLVTLSGTGITLTVDASGASAGVTAALTATTLTVSDFATGGSVGFAVGSLASLTVNTGSGNDTVTLTATPAGTQTAINTAGGNDTITVVSVAGPVSLATGQGNDSVTVRSLSAPLSVNLGSGTDSVLVSSAAGKLDDIQANLSVVGGGGTTLTLDDSASLSPRSLTLSGTLLTGLPAGATVQYSGLSNLLLRLSSAGTALTVTGTAAATATLVTGSGGNDTLNVRGTTGSLRLDASTGSTVVNVSGLGGSLDLFANAAGSLAVTVAAATGLAGVTGAVALTGAGTTSLTVDASGNNAGRTVNLAATSLSGLTAQPVTFSGLTNLTLRLAGGNDTLTVAAAPASAATSLDLSAGGADAVNLNLTTGTGTLALLLGNGGSAVRVSTVSAAVPVTITAGGDTASDVVTLGVGGVFGTLAGAVGVVGNGNTRLSVDDSAGTAARQITLSATTLGGLGAAALAYSGVAQVELRLGSAGDTVAVQATAATTPVSVFTGGGSDSVTVTTAASAVSIDAGGGVNTVRVLAATAPVSVATPASGSTAVALGSPTDSITATVGVTGPGALTIDDSAGVLFRTVRLTAGRVAGLLGSGVNLPAVLFDGISSLRLVLPGAGAGVLATAVTVPTTVVGSVGGLDSVAVGATTAVLSVDLGNTPGDSVSVGNVLRSSLAAVTAAVSVSGAPSLTIDGSASTAGAAPTLTATTFAGATGGTITYGGVTLLALTLGSGDDLLSVQSLPAGATVTLAGGAGNNTFLFGSGLTAPLLASTFVVGDGSDLLRFDDSASLTGRTVTLQPNRVLGLTSLPVLVSGLTVLDLRLGGGNDAVAVGPVNVPTVSVSTGAGDDSVTVDTAVATPTPTVPANITVSLGTGDDSLAVTSLRSAESLSVLAGGGTDGVTVPAGPAVAGAVSVDGSGSSATLTIDGSQLTTGVSVTVTGSSVAGLTPRPVGYVAVANLNVLLGGGNDTVTVNSTTAVTSIFGNAGNDSFVVTAASLASALAGRLRLDPGTGSDIVRVTNTGPGSGTLNVTATSLTGQGAGIDLLGRFRLIAADAGTGATLRITGPFPGSGVGAGPLPGAGPGESTVPLSLPGSSNIVFPNGITDDVTVGGPAGRSITVTGSISGVLNATADVSLLSVSGDITGSALFSGNLDNATVAGSISGTFNVTGRLGRLSVGGNSGTIGAGSIGIVRVDQARPDTGTGRFFAVVVGGQVRYVALGGASQSVLAGAVARIVYDATANGTPSVSIELTGPAAPAPAPRPRGGRTTTPAVPAQRFDVVVGGPGDATLDLARLATTGSAALGIRNIVVSGSILSALTSEQAAAVSTADRSAGVALPAERLAAVSARDNLAARSIRAVSVQGLGFGQIQARSGSFVSAAAMANLVYRLAQPILDTAFVPGARNRRVVAYVDPTESLLVPVARGAQVAIFTARKGNRFDGAPVLVRNTAVAGDALLASLSLSTRQFKSRRIVASLSFSAVDGSPAGPGASVDTERWVQNVISAATLGDVVLRSGRGTSTVLRTLGVTGSQPDFGTGIVLLRS